MAAYTWDSEQQTYIPFALDVLTFRGDKISEITSFITRTVDLPPDAFERYPDHPQDPRKLTGVFESFGLPPTVD